jgi:hypothetical protein
MNSPGFATSFPGVCACPPEVTRGQTTPAKSARRRLLLSAAGRSINLRDVARHASARLHAAQGGLCGRVKPDSDAMKNNAGSPLQVSAWERAIIGQTILRNEKENFVKLHFYRFGLAIAAAVAIQSPSSPPSCGIGIGAIGVCTIAPQAKSTRVHPAPQIRQPDKRQ